MSLKRLESLVEDEQVELQLDTRTDQLRHRTANSGAYLR